MARGCSGVDGRAGKLEPDEACSRAGPLRPGFVHSGQPMAVSITQQTRGGDGLQPEEIRAIAAIAKAARTCRSTWTARALPTRSRISASRRRR